MIGDLAGHLRELRGELERLGARDDRLPDDLTVVQVGDLVHRGPDSEGVVALVARYLSRQPDQWVQLIGNHEAQYVREPAFAWPERIDDAAIDTLRGWWRTGRMRVAAAVRADDGEAFVITHAGLTAGFWTGLGAPASAAEAAAAINATAAETVFRAGAMLGGAAPDLATGPVWAAAASELVPSWLGVAMPFSQVHGHSRLGDVGRHQLFCDAELVPLMDVDEQAAHIGVRLAGGRLVGIDPGHGRRARRPWRAFEIEGAVVTPSLR